MNYLQYYECMTGRWTRDSDEGSLRIVYRGPRAEHLVVFGFDTILEALERRDEISCGWPNDGVSRGVRAVDECGNVLEYEKRYI